MYRVICDSSCDIREYEGVDFQRVPVFIYNDDKTYCDDENLDVPEMLDELEKYKGRTCTSCPTVESWISVFSADKENYVITLTSAMSGTYNSACVARDMFLEEHADAKFAIFDSLSTGAEMKMAVDKIVSYKEQGYTMDQIMEEIPRYLRLVRMFWVMKSTSHMLENGRISSEGSKSGIFNNLRVLTKFNLKGTIDVVKKFRGKRKTITGVIHEMEMLGYHGGKVRITFVETASFALKMGKELRQQYPEANIEYGCCGGLCSFYLERGGVIVGFETDELLADDL